jgi:uncharacterized membrane protein YhhN
MSVELASLWWPLAVMAVDWAAVAGRWRRLEYLAKPAAMAALLLWLGRWGMAAGAWPAALTWFALGAGCSLAGDVLLLLPGRFFRAGLVAFLLGHVAYIIGLNTGGLRLPAEAALLVPAGLAAAWVIARVGGGLKAQGQDALWGPVAIYAVVISLMVASAGTTLWRPDWPAGLAGLASMGAVLFFGSDVLLAWDRFVAPVKGARVLVMVAYHLGQVALIAAAAGRFTLYPA